MAEFECYFCKKKKYNWLDKFNICVDCIADYKLVSRADLDLLLSLINEDNIISDIDYKEYKRIQGELSPK